MSNWNWTGLNWNRFRVNKTAFNRIFEIQLDCNWNLIGNPKWEGVLKQIRIPEWEVSMLPTASMARCSAETMLVETTLVTDQFTSLAVILLIVATRQVKGHVAVKRHIADKYIKHNIHRSCYELLHTVTSRCSPVLYISAHLPYCALS